MFFWNSLAFSMVQQMLAIWSLVPLPFLKPAWTSGSLQFTYCWSLAWRILSINLLACEMMQLCGSLSILWHCFSLGLEWKLTFSSPLSSYLHDIVILLPPWSSPFSGFQDVWSETYLCQNCFWFLNIHIPRPQPSLLYLII